MQVTMLPQTRAAPLLSGLSTRATTKIYLLLAGLAVLAYTMITPPFQVPDEQGHLFRAYELSEGQLRGELRDGVAGAELPSSLIEMAERFLGSRALHLASRPTGPAPIGATASALPVPLQPERREFVDFSNTAFYSPLPYLPQVVAIALGRAAGLGPLPLLYAARLANGLAAVLVIAAAIAILPAGGVLLAVFASLPMTQYMLGSASPDALLIAGAFLLAALLFRGRLRGRMRNAEFWLAIGAGILVCSTKPVYAPLLLLALPAVLRPGTRGHWLIVQAALLAIPIGLAVRWLAFSGPLMVSSMPGSDSARQVTWIEGHPGEFVRVLLFTIRLFATEWFREVIGRLGWHDTWLRTAMYLPPVLAASLCLLLPTPRETRPGLLDTLWWALLVAASAVLVLIAGYISWTGIGNGFVGGIQGRYFLPLLAPVAIALEGRLGRLPGRLGPVVALLVLAVMAAETVWTLAFVARTYAVF